MTLSTQAHISNVTTLANRNTKPTKLRVRKRDGVILEIYDGRKIGKAMKLAFEDTNTNIPDNFDDLVADANYAAIKHAKNNDDIVEVEQIQDVVKYILMQQHQKVSESYIIYANKRSEIRSKRLDPDAELLADYIQLTKYARYNATLKRRELWQETNNRYRQMHIDRYPQISSDIEWACDLADRKVVLPSMRSRQYGGEAQLMHHIKGYNCSFGYCNRLDFFKEMFYLLLCGCGVGFSVQHHHVSELPPIKSIDHTKVKHHVVGDSIEGWADAIDDLFNSYQTGEYVEFSYHKIRPQGTSLKTSGGRAPGHIPLRDAIEQVRGVLNRAQNRQLESIECYDVTCMISDAVYSGGIREAALICLFSIDDQLMTNAKTGEWHKTHPWRMRSNNSVILHRDTITRQQFDKIFESTKQWGEPGFYFTDDLDIGGNPCNEISLYPQIKITDDNKAWLEKWASDKGRKIPDLEIGDIYYGFQLCNLTEINMAACRTVDEFMQAVKAATILGTCQAGYSDFPYMGWATEAITDREALLGVSMTGMMDNPSIALDSEVQRNGAKYAIDINKEFAAKLGIQSAARVTCVKPSGSASLVVGGVGSGIHPHHARRYFRRIKANPGNPIYEYFKQHNPHMCQDINQFKSIITFPITAPLSAMLRDDLGAVEFLEIVKDTQINWVMSGTAQPDSTLGARHNVSNTITVKNHEWIDVANYLWDNKLYFSGVSMLGHVGDKEYENAPREAVVNDADEAKWQYLINNYKPINWADMVENEDNTQLSGEVACAGGACEINL